MQYSLYLHIPFCTHRCAYCDFNTYAGQEESIPAYVGAICAEIEMVGRGAAQGPGLIRLKTIFFGGGTPSLLNPAQFRSILGAIRANFDLDADAETTIEANPGTVMRADLDALRALGINRISFGLQSANPEELRLLERTHSFPDLINAVGWARAAGFRNLNLDLIYGLPEQQVVTWKTSLKRAVDLGPEHLSLYALTLEHGTPFGRWAAGGLMPLPDPDLAAEMYEWAAEYLADAGYGQYEISNWAKVAGPDRQGGAASQPAYACSHNLQYWRSGPYLGLGAGAHGYAAGLRYSNVLRIRTYIDRLSDGDRKAMPLPWPLTPAAVNQHRNSTHEDMSEFMITGLRLTREGVSEAEFSSRFGAGLEDVYGEAIERLIRLDLLEWVALGPHETRTGMPANNGPERLRLTPGARLLANQVFIAFVD